MSDQKQVEREINSPIPNSQTVEAHKRAPQELSRRRFLQLLGVGTVAALAPQFPNGRVFAKEDEAVETRESGTDGAHALPLEGLPDSNILTPEQNTLLDKTNTIKIYYGDRGTFKSEEHPDYPGFRTFLKASFEAMLKSGVPEYERCVEFLLEKNNGKFSNYSSLLTFYNAERPSGTTHPIVHGTAFQEKYPRTVLYLFTGEKGLIGNVPPNSTHAIISIHQTMEMIIESANFTDKLVSEGKNGNEARSQLGNVVNDMNLKLAAMKTVMDTYLANRDKLIAAGVIDSEEVAQIAEKRAMGSSAEEPEDRKFQLMKATKDWLGWRLPDEELKRLASK